MSKKSEIKYYKAHVEKTVLKWPESFHREVHWLGTLDSPRFPKIISYDAGCLKISMTHCGELINKKNCPNDWIEQSDCILSDLKKHNCSHNDIKPSEILVKDGNIMLVDFGWASEIGDLIPANWPINLGGDFAMGQHNFDDEYSLKKSIKHVLGLICL